MLVVAISRVGETPGPFGCKGETSLVQETHTKDTCESQRLGPQSQGLDTKRSHLLGSPSLPPPARLLGPVRARGGLQTPGSACRSAAHLDNRLPSLRDKWPKWWGRHRKRQERWLIWEWGGDCDLKCGFHLHLEINTSRV